MSWIRYTFTTTEEDYRPVTFPPPGPYWCTGQRSDEAHTMVAYLRPDDRLLDFWPEAEGIDTQEVEKLTFTTRFPKPSWWTELEQAMKEKKGEGGEHAHVGGVQGTGGSARGRGVK